MKSARWRERLRGGWDGGINVTEAGSSVTLREEEMKWRNGK